MNIDTFNVFFSTITYINSKLQHVIATMKDLKPNHVIDLENVHVKQVFLVTNATNVQKRFSIESKDAIEVSNGDFISKDRFLQITF